MGLVITLLYNLVNLYSLILVVFALMSWFPGAYETKFGRLIITLVEPVVRPFRRFRLQFGGIDWTIFVIMILLNGVSNFLIRLLASLL